MPLNINGNTISSNITNSSGVIQNYPTAVQNGLVLWLDAGRSQSYYDTNYYDCGYGCQYYSSNPGCTNCNIQWNDISPTYGKGTLINGPTFSYANGGSIVFDGSNDYVNVPYNAQYNTPNGATYEIWVYPTAAGEFLTRGTSDSGTFPDNPRFYVATNGELYFDWSITGADTYVNTVAGTVTLNQWNHIVGVAEPNVQLRTYVNGVQSTYGTVSRTLPSTLPNTSDPIIIGGAAWIPRYFAGRISIVRLYNRTLSTTEITQNFNVDRGRFGI